MLLSHLWMRLVFKILMKLVMMGLMVLVMGGVMKYGMRKFMPGAGGGGAPSIEGVDFSSEESDLMSTVFQSALRLVSGRAKRDELAGELSEKLYGDRGRSEEMSELGIELVESSSGGSETGHGAALSPSGKKQPAQNQLSSRISKSPTKRTATREVTGEPIDPGVKADVLSDEGRTALPRLWQRAKAYSVELAIAPVVLIGMILVSRTRRKNRGESFIPNAMATLPPAETETYEMKHAVHSLNAEEFQLLVALTYQRQGWRVALPAGLGGGRGGDFTLARKTERLIVQCKKLNQEHEVPIERVRELYDAVTASGATRGVYVASCRFTWDARNFAKANRVTLVNSRILDELITAAQENPEENLLDVAQWTPDFMKRVELTTPLCPACDDKMEQVKTSESSVWVCSHRPDCRGRRCARKHQKPAPARRVADLSESVPRLMHEPGIGYTLDRADGLHGRGPLLPPEIDRKPVGASLEI